MVDKAAAAQRRVEQRLAALTYIQFNWDDDRVRAHENLKPLFDAYSMAELREGALDALALILLHQALTQDVPLVDYISAQRPILDPSLNPEV